jgi:gliding motility-associated-like protein
MERFASWLFLKAMRESLSVRLLLVLTTVFTLHYSICCQNLIITQGSFSSSFGEETFGQNLLTYRINYLFSSSANSSDNIIYPGILQPEENEDELPLFIPNGFSPNGDNINDTWTIEDIIKFQDYRVKVINKSGGIMYNEQSPNSIIWDGTFNGSIVASSDYYYVVNIESINKTYTGSLTVKSDE